MNTLIEVEWKDGRITRFPDTGYEGDNFGENVMPEMDIRFDDVSHGLYLEVRHHEPHRPKSTELGRQGEEQDPRGFPCRIFNDYFIELISGEDMEDVVWVTYAGQPRFVRINGELVNLAKIVALQKLYIGDPGASSAILSQIAELLVVIEPQVRARLATSEGGRHGNVDDACATELGVSRSILYAARSFLAAKEAEEAPFDGSLPPSDSDGDSDAKHEDVDAIYDLEDFCD